MAYGSLPGGGARKGAGRPKQTLSARQVKAILRKMRKWSKQTGYDIDEFLLAVIGGDCERLNVDSVPLRDRIACAKLFKELTMTRLNEQTADADGHVGPAIYLPEIKGGSGP